MDSPTAPRVFRLPGPVLLALVLVVTAILIGLGVWQLQRNEWKQDLVAERNARTDVPPLTLDAARATSADDLDYHRLAAEGEWDFERSFTLANRARFGTKGEELVTPLLIAPGGPAVLVNRGWYPASERAGALAALELRPGTVEGLVRTDTDSGRLTDAGTWTALDPAAMGAALPYEVLDWIVIEGELVETTAIPDGVLPVQRYARFANTTPHMEYALTWFGLAAALVAVAIIRLVVVPRRERGRAHGSAQPPPEGERTPPADVARDLPATATRSRR